MNDTAQHETKVGQEIATHPSLIKKFAMKYSIEPKKLLGILKATAFKQRDKDAEVSDEQMAALLVVADQYGLNPFTREIFAFPDKQNGIVPVVSVDGWNRIANDHPEFDGIEFAPAGEFIKIDDDAKGCPAWMDVAVYRKDRSKPIVVREYLDEVYRPKFQKGDYVVKGPWQSHTKRMLRHKTMIQGLRVAFGFSGIYDEDEAHRIIEGEIIEHDDKQTPSTSETNTVLRDVAEVRQQERAAVTQDEQAVDVMDGQIADDGNVLTVVDVKAKLFVIEGKCGKAKLTKKDREDIAQLITDTEDMMNDVSFSSTEQEQELRARLDAARKAIEVTE